MHESFIRGHAQGFREQKIQTMQALASLAWIVLCMHGTLMAAEGPTAPGVAFVAKPASNLRIGLGRALHMSPSKLKSDKKHLVCQMEAKEDAADVIARVDALMASSAHAMDTHGAAPDEPSGDDLCAPPFLHEDAVTERVIEMMNSPAGVGHDHTHRKSLEAAKHRRAMIVSEINGRLNDIQRPGLSAFEIRTLDGLIVRLALAKKKWEMQILELELSGNTQPVEKKSAVQVPASRLRAPSPPASPAPWRPPTGYVPSKAQPPRVKPPKIEEAAPPSKATSAGKQERTVDMGGAAGSKAGEAAIKPGGGGAKMWWTPPVGYAPERAETKEEEEEDTRAIAKDAPSVPRPLQPFASSWTPPDGHMPRRRPPAQVVRLPMFQAESAEGVLFVGPPSELAPPDVGAAPAAPTAPAAPAAPAMEVEGWRSAEGNRGGSASSWTDDLGSGHVKSRWIVPVGYVPKRSAAGKVGVGVEVGVVWGWVGVGVGVCVFSVTWAVRVCVDACVWVIGQM